MSSDEVSSGVLRAGGLLQAQATQTSISESDPIDPIDARAYGHAALGARTVVRLVATPLGAAEDLALEFLGLRLVGVEESVARRRRQALGFPGWALANDPANGAYALAVVKDMERLARLVRSKPGAARQGHEQLGEQLARSVPHFLPTFYEQIGRTYIEAEQPKDAAAMFSRAREAERMYGLPIDEERRRGVFIEFALAGALSTRALDELADQLAASKPAFDAYQTFRELCVQRTLGGIPPSTRMAERLNKLAAAAGLNVNAESSTLLVQLLDGPAMARAAAGFWKVYRAPLLALAHESPTVRGKLLNMFPTPQPSTNDFVDWWLELLTRSGATDALTGPAGAVPPEAEAAGGPAAWIGRLVVRENQDLLAAMPAGVSQLLERMATRLQADGVAVDLIGSRTWRPDVDLIDLALALRIPLARPHAQARVSVSGYGRAKPRRDLIHVVDDPTFGPRLARALEDDLEFGHNHADQLPASEGAQRLLREWLDMLAGQLEHGGLPQIEYAVARLESAVSERTLARNATARARMAAADLATAVVRTLRGGILDEFGWPALEEAHARLTPGQRGVRMAESWPNLVLSDGQRAIVVGPERIVFEHDLRLPTRVPALSDPALVFTGGQLLVCWWDHTLGSSHAYWSARPGLVFDIKWRTEALFTWLASVELSDGGRTRGGRAIHPGDTSLPEPVQLLTDGSTFWRRGESGGLREYEPVSGRAGRASLPALFKTLAPDGDDPELESCWLLPALPGLESSPLGVGDGLLGWVVRQDRDGVGTAMHGRRIDGAEFTGRLASPGFRRGADGATPLGLLDFPGDDSAPRPFSVNSQSLSVWSADGAVELFAGHIGLPSDLAQGTPMVLPPQFWHCLRPRDPDGSRALRSLPDAVARQLFESALAEVAADHGNLPKTLQLAGQVLPEVTHPRLREGIVGVCGVAARLAQRLAAIEAVHIRAKPRVATVTRHAIDDRQLRAALTGLFTEHGWYAGDAGRSHTLEQIQLVGAVADGGEIPATIPVAPMPWPQLLGRLGAVAFRAANPATSASDREALLTFLDVLAATPIVAKPDHLRVAEVMDTAAVQDASGYVPRVLRDAARRLMFKRGYRTWLLNLVQVDPDSRRALRLLLELSPDGSFELPRDYDLVSSLHVVPATWDADCIRTFTGLVCERGPLAWRPELVDRVATATGLTRPEASLLLAGLPGIRTYTEQGLPTDMRRILGLTVRDAAAALESFESLPGRTLRDVLAAAMPDDPHQLWDSDVWIDRLANAWNEHVGRRVALPEDVVRQLGSALDMALPATDVLTVFARPDTDPRLNSDGVWMLTESASGGWTVARRDGDAAVFDGALLTSLAATFAWLSANVPVGDALRGHLPVILERARQRLANRDLLVGTVWLHDFPSDPGFFEALPGAQARAADGRPIANSHDMGVLILRREMVGMTPYASALVRPAAALDADYTQLVPFMGSLATAYAAARFLLGPSAASMAERVVNTPVPTGGYEANPLLSVPELVGLVASKLNLDQDAAMAYLQVLTLTEPTTRNLAVWNGWRPKQLSTALGPLVERGLLIRGTRLRAGRDVFLPGAWEDLRAPNLPIESWKLALYDYGPLDGRVLPLRPLHELFAAAWQRIESGDAPGFESVPAVGRRT